jgi:phage tail-like protein
VSSRDANDTTWYVLRYREDFTPRVPSPADPSPPRLDATLSYDEAAGVLELLPQVSADEATPPPGVCVDLDGDVYLTTEGGGPLRHRRCDGSEVPFPCEPHVLATPMGLALDRRGLLYVADRAAKRVVILTLEGHVEGILAGDGLVEPVDVAVAPSGRIYVADREGGRIRVYDASFRHCQSFLPRGLTGLPRAPRPIAVMVGGDGAVLVADAQHPRLLRFSPDGKPLGEPSITARAAALAGGDVALDALERAYGKRLPRARAGACGTCAPADDAGRRLAEVHCALRILALRLAHSYAQNGQFVSAALDGKRPGATWHKLVLDADIPAGTAITVETTTAERREGFDAATAMWVAPLGPTGKPVSFSDEICDQLVQSPPGRYLWVRVTLLGGGDATPSLRLLEVFYPRRSYLEELPRLYRRDAVMAGFLEHFLALFERVLTGVENRWERFACELNPDAAPRELIDWLACLVDLAFDPSWPLEKRRALVAAAMELYRTRGTVRGLERYVEIYTGKRPIILEDFLTRASSPSFLGRAGSVLGCMFRLGLPLVIEPPEEALRRSLAHRFTVVVFVDDDCDAATLLPVVDRIVTSNKPAHTIHTLRPVEAGARVGQMELGVDFVVGAAEVARWRLDGCPTPAAGAVLGRDVVLGTGRPQFVSPLGQVLT